MDHIEMNLRHFYYTATLISHAVISKDDLLNPIVVSV
jgi:hypothetical protein